MPAYNCRKSNGVYTNTTWQYFYVRCPKLNLLCSATSGAYVAAVTVCRQALWT